jgi:hypothetical protein
MTTTAEIVRAHADVARRLATRIEQLGADGAHAIAAVREHVVSVVDGRLAERPGDVVELLVSNAEAWLQEAAAADLADRLARRIAAAGPNLPARVEALRTHVAEITADVLRYWPVTSTSPVKNVADVARFRAMQSAISPTGRLAGIIVLADEYDAARRALASLDEVDQ